ncbi:unnamed protein product [Dovyalis caffra]|uniref:At1g68980-like TPR repeats domain-containing protein n=1 Tax=Dovyalis caffra TaxID=77055 RepID=A0AAV1SUK4_9ROSI|nr:unnamed protein product [Dovyalis caffra]
MNNYAPRVFVPSAVQETALIADHSREFSSKKSFGRFQELGVFCEQYQFVALQRFSSGSVSQPGRICWRGSSNAVLLRKLEVALQDHQVDEAWVTFIDFKNLYGFPTSSMVSRLISLLSYSSDPHWLQKACDLVFLILKEKPDLLQFPVLTNLSLSLARAQMPAPASMILRVMLERENMPPLNILWSVVSHMLKTEIGTCLASNFLVQMCDCFLRLSAKRSVRAKVVKPDAMIFNLVLDACVRFKSTLKGQEIVELMSQTGIIADANSVIIFAQIHEMNGQRDEIKKLKDHVDRVCAPFLGYYWQFYDSLLKLHFKFDDLDSAAELVLDMHKFQKSVPGKKSTMDQEKPLLVPIGSNNLKTGLTIQVMPELLQKDSILGVKHKQESVIFRSGKLLLSNRALAKLVNGYRRNGRTTELSKLLLCIQEDFHALGQSSLCSDVIDACILLGWLEMAHDILDDMDAAGVSLGSTSHMALLTAYYSREMFKEAKTLLRKMRKAGFDMKLSDEMVATACLSEAANDASSSSSKSDLINFLVREMREKEKVIPSAIYELNSSIYYFCKAKMMEDALKTYRRMQHMKIQPTVQTFAYLIDGFSSLGMYRDITILWGDIKRNMGSKEDLELSRDLYEVLLLNFIRGGYFERAMEVIGHMKERDMYCDKWMYKAEFLKFHKNLYWSLKASEARTEAQRKRLEYVKTFRKWVGID